MVRLILGSTLTAAAALGTFSLGGAAALDDPSAAAPAAVAAAAGTTTADSRAADSVAADSAALADSVRLVTRLLIANGAPAERAAPVATAVMRYARLRALDPLLVVGVIGVENAQLVTRARSSAGALGVMQVMPHWKRDIRDCGEDLRDVDVNVCFGTRVLRIAIDESPSLARALRRYNGCVRAPTCDTYPAAVFSRVGRAVLAARIAE